MCPMLLNSLSDGPAMVLSPRQDHAFVQFPRQPKFTPDPESRSFFASNNNLFPSRPSRKRSRDDASFEEAINGNNTSMSFGSAAAPSMRKQVEEPIYGEGMVLLNPRTKMAISAESQTGTWYEEIVENATTAVPASARRDGNPSSSGRKSQRLDPSAPSVDDITLSSIQRKLHSTDQQDDNRRILNVGNRSEEPTVDDATRLLGISWQRIATDDSDMAAAVRGWKKYIDRQFAAYLADSQILLKNRALNAYLVTARPTTPMGLANTSAFYLFNDDLTQAQLVGSTWEACLMNLRSSPIVFEGTQILNAADRPLQNGMTSMGAQNILGANPADSGLPLLQTLCAQPMNLGNGMGLNNSVGMGTGMEIDA
ncbi:uncharacterized protein BO80DRAFT_166084 [Aspergillus ibericus CBS 121593]|uniref:Uncharacterized protein n=1 Tax=Aspergillus ibericus CBS 121593 TaxID=1448316 RepID=A0A395GTL7_9EURO|nr:hypothetical protein BO80DRAFT_166084 [Aspergillus ibericus CBS 121593]RAK98298.1 hypothetical protein BO80DRAFT_166084 [Aspergillus ibericus CBS 121593]